MQNSFPTIFLVCTGTTGGLIRNAFDEKGIAAEVICMHSGPLGGDAENCCHGGTQGGGSGGLPDR